MHREFTLKIFGIHFDVEEIGASGALIRSETKLQLPMDEYFEVEITRDLRIFRHLAFLVGIDVHKNYVSVGIRWKGNETFDKTNNRRSQRVTISQMFPVTAIFSDPNNFDDFIIATLLDISTEGLRLETSLRNKFLREEQHLAGTLNFPMTGAIPVRAKIKRMGESFGQSDEPVLEIGVELETTTELFRSSFEHYLRFFSDENYLEFESQVKRNAKKPFQMKIVNSIELFQKIKTIRVAMRVPELPLQLICNAKLLSYNGKSEALVAATRIALYTKEQRTAARNLFELPNDFPSALNQVEIFDVTILDMATSHIDSILFDIWSQAVVTAAAASREYIVGIVPSNLVALFSKMGAVKTTVEDFEHTLMVAKTVDIMMGQNLTFDMWYRLGRLPYLDAKMKNVDLPPLPTSWSLLSFLIEKVRELFETTS